MTGLYGTPQQRNALGLADSLRARTGHGSAWRCLRREDIANQLGTRAYDPSLIDQGNTNLCGIAAFVRHWAADDPEGYVRFAINLYEKGAARLGRGDVQRNVVASAGLRSDRSPRGVPHADWLVLSAIRENFNNIFGYRSTTVIGPLDEMVAGANFPDDVVLGLRTVGYQRERIIDRTNPFAAQSINSALEASEKFRLGWRVILLIHSNMLVAEEQRGGRAPIVRSNHWVGLMSEISISADRRWVFPFTIFNRGTEHLVPYSADPRYREGATTTALTLAAANRDRPVTRGYFDDITLDTTTPASEGLTVQDFVDHYYGFIAAKY